MCLSKSLFFKSVFCIQNTDKIEFVATEHFWMSGMYWGLSALHLLGREGDVEEEAIVSWVLSCRHVTGGFGGSPRNDPHLLYTLSAVQILALYNKLDLLDSEEITKCRQHAWLMYSYKISCTHA
jgi:geranylgeranyl transferase type-2 subunit beta